jgi:sugar-specific transcriptional regulator TrmB
MDVLKQFNLTEKESAVYVAALELGTTSAASIAKKSGIQRTHFYDISESLINAGFLQRVSKENKRLYSVIDPETLIQMEERKIEKLKQTLPEFKALYNTSGKKPKITYYEGRSGIEQINEDTLRYKGEAVAFTTPQFVAFPSGSTGKVYIEKRVAMGNHVRVIGEDAPEIRELHEKDAQELRETRILSSDVFRSEIEIGIYGSKVFVIDYKGQFGFIIEDTEIARVMKMIFEIVWGMWEK